MELFNIIRALELSIIVILGTMMTSIFIHKKDGVERAILILLFLSITVSSFSELLTFLVNVPEGVWCILDTFTVSMVLLAIFRTVYYMVKE